MSTAATAPAPADLSLSDQIQQAIEASPHLESRHLRVETSGGAVRIHGNVRSYFQKQIAQEVIRRLDGVELVENQLEVTWV